MHWLVDGYNVIRREPALAEREREGLEAGRQALCRLLSNAARVFGRSVHRRLRREPRGR